MCKALFQNITNELRIGIATPFVGNGVLEKSYSYAHGQKHLCMYTLYVYKIYSKML